MIKKMHVYIFFVHLRGMKSKRGDKKQRQATKQTIKNF